MIALRIAGRGGQGVVLASKILAEAFFEAKWWVQAFPSFGAERRGAPVSAFLRVDAQEITLRCGIERPDWLILFDAELLSLPDIVSALSPKTSLVLNARQVPPLSREGDRPAQVFVVDAMATARRWGLSRAALPVINTAMVGAFARASGLLDFPAVGEALNRLVPSAKDANTAAAKDAYERVREVIA